MTAATEPTVRKRTPRRGRQWDSTFGPMLDHIDTPLPASLADRLDQAAVVAFSSKAAVVRRLLNEHLPQLDQPTEIA